jgi:hypothetical protein
MEVGPVMVSYKKKNKKTQKRNKDKKKTEQEIEMPP